MFRLETDYNYQDIEQLRIRLEAFSEVLAQRKYAGVTDRRKIESEKRRTEYGKETVAV